MGYFMSLIVVEGGVHKCGDHEQTVQVHIGDKKMRRCLVI